MFCFRVFHASITDMVRGSWIRYVRRYNLDQLGSPTDLDEFLFGSERVPLTAYVPILREVQEAKCFYCGSEIRLGAEHVDHFVPWAMYPADLGHNFVLADRKCNVAKSDYLAAKEHLARWSTRNRKRGSELSIEFDRKNIIHDIHASQTIVEWAYTRAHRAGAATFRAARSFEKLTADWRNVIETVS